MTVIELIRALRKFPPHMPVAARGARGSHLIDYVWDDPECVEPDEGESFRPFKYVLLDTKFYADYNDPKTHD